MKILTATLLAFGLSLASYGLEPVATENENDNDRVSRRAKPSFGIWGTVAGRSRRRVDF